MNISDEDKSMLLGEIEQMPANTSNSDLLCVSGDVYNMLSGIESIHTTYKELSEGRTNYISISNLPTSKDNPQVGEFIAIGLSKFLGVPFQYKEQNEGRLNGHLTPKEAFADKKDTGEGDGIFGWHTDDAIFEKELRTTWIQLYCECNDSKTITKIAVLSDIIDQLDNRDVDLLMEDRFVFIPPHSFHVTDETFLRCGKVLDLVGDTFEISYSSYNCFPQDKNDVEAKSVLKQIHKIADQISEEVTLAKGQALTFNNNRVIHCRNAVLGKRSLYRTYIRENLDVMNHAKASKSNIYSIYDLRSFVTNIGSERSMG